MATFLAPDKGKKASMMDMALDDVVAANKPKKKQGGGQQQQGGGKAAKKKGAARFDPYGAGGGGRRGGRQVAYGAPADVLCGRCGRGFAAADIVSFQQHILSKHSKAKNVQQQKGGAQKKKVPATALPLASRSEPTVGETPAPLLEIPAQPSAGASVVSTRCS